MINEVHIPTVKGASNVINIQTPTTTVGESRYIMTITQVGAGNAPTIDGVIIPNSVIGGGVFAFVSDGNYDYDKVGMFPNGTAKVVVEDSLGGKSSDVASVYLNYTQTTNDKLRIVTKSLNTGAEANGMLDQNRITITDYSTSTEAPTNNEETFNYIMSLLDVNQVKLWSKIVVRFGGTVTEVDGNTYRRLANFGQSSKIIES